MRAMRLRFDDDSTPPVIAPWQRFAQLQLSISAPSTLLTPASFSMQKFTILPIDISVETGDITPSLKLKRSELEAKCVT
jgi:hypothetical protein